MWWHTVTVKVGFTASNIYNDLHLKLSYCAALILFILLQPPLQGPNINNYCTYPTGRKKDGTIFIVMWNKNGWRCAQIDLMQNRWEISYIVHSYLPNTRSAADICTHWITHTHTYRPCWHTYKNKLF